MKTEKARFKEMEKRDIIAFELKHGSEVAYKWKGKWVKKEALEVRKNKSEVRER